MISLTKNLDVHFLAEKKIGRHQNFRGWAHKWTRTPNPKNPQNPTNPRFPRNPQKMVAGTRNLDASAQNFAANL